jgi:ceramide glucosyltransferase
VLALALARGAYWALVVAVAALAVRLWAVRVEERALRLPAAPVWLVAARDLLSFAVFAVAHGGHSVTWRGRTFKVDRQGNLVPVGDR